MTKKIDEDKVKKGRRKFLSFSGYAAAGFVGGIVGRLFDSPVEKAWDSLYGYLEGFTVGGQEYEKFPVGLEYFLGDDPRNTCIMSPGTNKRALARGKLTPSIYVRNAYTNTSALHKQILGIAEDFGFDYTHEESSAERYKNKLVIGGPVATYITKVMCGYVDVSNQSNPQESVPMFNRSAPLPFGFYVGNENGYGFWEDERRTIKRWDEYGELGDYPVYGIYDRGSGLLIPEPEKDGIAVGDMLMIARLPNPEDITGSVTIVGGLHGYSLNSFVSNLIDNIEHFSNFINPKGYKYFQALLPYSINGNGSCSLDIEGWGNWRGDIKPIDEKLLLSYCNQLRGFD